MSQAGHFRQSPLSSSFLALPSLLIVLRPPGLVLKGHLCPHCSAHGLHGSCMVAALRRPNAQCPCGQTWDADTEWLDVGEKAIEDHEDDGGGKKGKKRAVQDSDEDEMEEEEDEEAGDSRFTSSLLGFGYSEEQLFGIGIWSTIVTDHSARPLERSFSPPKLKEAPLLHRVQLLISSTRFESPSAASPVARICIEEEQDGRSLA
jgi:hypothetical protein